jgi:hypothetical protein
MLQIVCAAEQLIGSVFEWESHHVLAPLLPKKPWASVTHLLVAAPTAGLKKHPLNYGRSDAKRTTSSSVISSPVITRPNHRVLCKMPDFRNGLKRYDQIGHAGSPDSDIGKTLGLSADIIKPMCNLC